MKQRAHDDHDRKIVPLKEGGGRTRSRHSPRYILRLYVTGVTRHSRSAVERVREICERQLAGDYELEVIDLHQVPALAKGAQIVATPTLIRVLPEPLRRYIGNMTREDLLFGLELREGKR